MKIQKSTITLLFIVILLTSCQDSHLSTVEEIIPTKITPSGSTERTFLTYSNLTEGFTPQGIINEDALRKPDNAQPSPHLFEGHL